MTRIQSQGLNTASDLSKRELLFAAMAFPTVYFDIQIGAKAAGRIVMEVGSPSG